MRSLYVYPNAVNIVRRFFDFKSIVCIRTREVSAVSGGREYPIVLDV